MTKAAGGPKLLPAAPFQATYGGGSSDGFVTRVAAGGASFVWSTYLGGSGEDWAGHPEISGGNLYVPGYTASTNFPTALPAQASNHGGYDAFVTKFTGSGALVYSTYLGGAGNEIAYAVAPLADGSTWIAGYSTSTDLPVVLAPKPALSGTSDALLAKIDPAGAAFTYVTYVGGSGDEYAIAIALDSSGNPLIGGETSSSDLSTTSGAAQAAYGGGPGDGFLSTAPAAPVVVVDSFFLPKRVVAKVNAKDATKSTLIAAGFFDTGASAVDLTQPATLVVGGFTFNVPELVAAADGKSYTYKASGVVFSVVPNPSGSSRAKFKLTTTGDLTGMIALTGDLDLRFTQGAVDGRCTVALAGGKYALGKIRGALVAPNLFLVRSKETVKGGGKDSLSVVVGLATKGVTPAAPSALTIAFGGTFSQTIPAASFVKKGDQFQFKGNAGGITKAVVDYLRETITISGKSLDLGAFAQGANSVLISAGLGSESRAVRVRMARKAATLTY